MAQRSLVWTALPNGITADGSALRLSVMLSPRLDPGDDPQRLDSFPEWLDWPATLHQAQIVVSCNGTTVTVPADGSGSGNVRDGRLGVPDSATWKALFTPKLFVRPYQFQDLTARRVISYDATAMAALVQGVYAKLAGGAGDQLPAVSSYGRPLFSLSQAVRALDAPPVVGIAAAAAANPLAPFKAFHTPLSGPIKRTATRTDDSRISARWTEYNRQKLPKPEDIAPQLDFHQIVSAMASYPTLLRRLGLVVDLLLDPTAFTDGRDVALSVAVTFPAGVLPTTKTTDGAPVTRSTLSPTIFEPLSDPAAAYPLRNRLLDLDPARLTLLQSDIDGAGSKLINFVRSLLRRGTAGSDVDPVTRQPDTAGVPSLRSAGLMLVQRQRAKWLAQRFQVNKQRNDTVQRQMGGGTGVVALHAEDLLRGYRVDIWDGTAKRWASLCRRMAHYELGDSPAVVDVAEEESTLRLAATTSADPTSNAHAVSLHEALLTWNGWSLAAPPPGRNVGTDDGVDTSQDHGEAAIPPGLHFSSRFRPVPGSLPRLRFGRRYWLRARAVDLAGNSLDFQPTDFGSENPASHAVAYVRFEPVAAPVLALLSQRGAVAPPGPGESIARMAIRSLNDTAADNTVPTTEVAHRAAVPPRVSAREAEQHGMLDKGGLVDASTFVMLANERDRDGHDPLAVVREVVMETGGPLGSDTAQTTFAVHELGRAMTYLPDPLASEVAVRIFGHPNADEDAIIKIPLYPEGAWPEARPFVIVVLDDATAAPSFDAGKRQLFVPLPKAARAVVRMSMTLGDAALATMGVFGWLDSAGQAAQRQRARDGQHWMLTPWRTLDVVHAVQRPLLTPEIVSVSIDKRNLGETHVRPIILARCSIASTDRLDLRSTSHEPVDGADGPAARQRNDAAFQVKVTDPSTYATVLDGAADGGFPDHTIPASDHVSINAPASADLTVKAQEFHDTRYRRIAYWFDATSRFREYLPSALLTGPGPSEQNIIVTGQASGAWVPSSAPAPAPGVLYVVPTFAWRREEDGDGNAVSERRGGLRVYLDRPWNTSGFGEMLAVVLPPGDFTGDLETVPAGDPLKAYVTQWGADPVWDSGVVSGMAPHRTDFPLARFAPDPSGAWLPPGAPATESDQPVGPFKVAGLTSSGHAAALEVAPHDVAWSDERQLWYCDIGLDPGTAYFPFVRLALARYQPVSIEGAYLSNIVLADFTVLTPSRWLAVATTADARSRRVTVSGYGYTNSSGSYETSGIAGAVAVARKSVIEVWVEQLDARLGEDFGWQQVTSVVVTQTPVSGPTGSSAEVLWNGEVRVPEATDGLGPYRLVIGEYEEFITDMADAYGPVPTSKGRRLVFTETQSLLF